MLIKNIRTIIKSKPRGIICVDGFDGSGKTYFAKNLSNILSQNGVDNLIISIDDFHLPKDKRYERGMNSSLGFYEDSYDYNSFIDKVLIPFKNNLTEICSKSFDLISDFSEISIMKIPEKCWLIVEGIFLQRSELRKFWDISIYLKISEAESLDRNLKREFGDMIPDGAHERFLARYIGGQRLYHEEFQPEKSADFVVDNSDFMNPKII